MIAALGVASGAVVSAAIVDVGAVWMTLHLDSADRVTELGPDMTLLENSYYACTGVTVFGLSADGDTADVEVRSFAPADGVPEDPVCGSGNGCVAAVIRRNAVLDTTICVARQGRMLGRDGRVEVEFANDGTIWLGGCAVTCVRDDITLWRAFLATAAMLLSLPNNGIERTVRGRINQRGMGRRSCPTRWAQCQEAAWRSLHSYSWTTRSRWTQQGT